jgi:hypothetical protein
MINDITEVALVCNSLNNNKDGSHAHDKGCDSNDFYRLTNCIVEKLQLCIVLFLHIVICDNRMIL